jgi:hypothetical protein
LRNPIFPKNRISWTINPFIPVIRCTEFSGHVWAGLRNPIFPKNRISWTINPFLPVIRCTFWGTFGHGLRNPIFPKNRISWTINPFLPVIRCTFWARLGRVEKSDFSKKSDFLDNQSVSPRHPLY